jgi:hypothetical protein
MYPRSEAEGEASDPDTSYEREDKIKPTNRAVNKGKIKPSNRRYSTSPDQVS